ncbi:hypothetical protein [Thaumasiovibrio sp. DFM-14]|uniref:hypothetical protein n=1 Tax=Thaumasiovibrio sp. DFM-14 TaxID=3384792 RepID=UPI0039A06C57
MKQLILLLKAFYLCLCASSIAYANDIVQCVIINEGYISNYPTLIKTEQTKLTSDTDYLESIFRANDLEVLIGTSALISPTNTLPWITGFELDVRFGKGNYVKAKSNARDVSDERLSTQLTFGSNEPTLTSVTISCATVD